MAAIDLVNKFFSNKKKLSVSTSKDDSRGIHGHFTTIEASQTGIPGSDFGAETFRERCLEYDRMNQYPDICSALNIYCDDATQVDSEKGKIVWFESDNGSVEKDLNKMLLRIEAEEDVWAEMRTVAQYGNDFSEILINDEGVQGLKRLPIGMMTRIDDYDDSELGYIQSLNPDTEVTPERFKETFKNYKYDPNGRFAMFEPWRISHTRLRSRSRDSLYGYAISEPARWIWRRLIPLEDAVMVYKLSRSPSRYAFYIDVGSQGKEEAERTLRNARDAIKRRKYVDPSTGKMTSRLHPMAMDEDFFLATREGADKSRIEVLNGPSYQQMDDVNYFKSELYAALTVPKAYLGYDESLPGKASLAQEDVRFARSVLRFQSEKRFSYNKIARVELCLKNIDPTSVSFNARMTVPSQIFELGQMEVRRARADLASTMQAHVSIYYLLKEIYGFTDEETADIMKQRKGEMVEQGGGQFGESAVRKNVITEKELFAGHRKDDQQKAKDLVLSEMKKNDKINYSRHKETSMLLREIAAAKSKR